MCPFNEHVFRREIYYNPERQDEKDRHFREEKPGQDETNGGSGCSDREKDTQT